MTPHPPAEQRSLFDLPLTTTRAHIADLQAMADTTRPIPGVVRTHGPLGRVRDGLGAWLIGLGAAVMADESLKRRLVRS